MDLDTVSLKNISLLGKNFAARESEELVANGVINLDRQSWIGSTLAEQFLKYVLKQSTHQHIKNNMFYY